MRPTSVGRFLRNEVHLRPVYYMDSSRDNIWVSLLNETEELGLCGLTSLSGETDVCCPLDILVGLSQSAFPIDLEG